jgi:hypothetical protein
MKVYQAICQVQRQLSATGISKSHRNTQQGYQFRGIDDVYNTLSPMLAEAGLCILPRMVSRSCEERQTAKGGTLFYVTVEAEFDFVAAEDGSKHTVRTFGEAMDSGDKATNKAMSAAYKYAAMQAFAIPTEGDNDADAHTHEVAPRQQRPQPRLESAPPVDVDAIRHGIATAADMDMLKRNFLAAIQMLPKAQHDAITKLKDKRKAELEKQPAQQFEDVPG